MKVTVIKRAVTLLTAVPAAYGLASRESAADVCLVLAALKKSPPIQKADPFGDNMMKKKGSPHDNPLSAGENGRAA